MGGKEKEMTNEEGKEKEMTNEGGKEKEMTNEGGKEKEMTNEEGKEKRIVTEKDMEHVQMTEIIKNITTGKKVGEKSETGDESEIILIRISHLIYPTVAKSAAPIE